MTTVTISSVIDAPIGEVWARIRDFNGMPGWHPRMTGSHIENGMASNEIGSVRNMTLITGARIREKLLEFSDNDHAITYSIVETPLPLSNHKATLRLIRVSDGERTFAEWSARFDAPPEEAQKIAKGMGENVFQGGFNALNKHFAGEK